MTSRLIFGIGVILGLIGVAASLAPADTVGEPAPTTLEQIRQWNQTGRIHDAERAARATLIEAERVHGTESLEVAEILDELAVALRRGGKTSEPEALEVCQRALRIKEQAVGVKDPRYAASLYNLGLLHFTRKEYTRALSELSQTLEIRESTLGSNHPDIAKSLLALGSVNHDMGNYEEGLSLTERAVSIEEIALGKNNPERARGLDALAVAHYSVGDFAGSIPLYEEAIALWEQSPNPNQAAIAACCNNLGAVYDDVGDHLRAIEVLKRALHLRESEYGPSHPLVANTLSVLGSVLMDTGDLSGARRCFTRAIRILEAKAPRDRDLGWVRVKLGWLYLKEGDLARADESFRQSLREREAALGTEHPDLWTSLRGLAMVAKHRGQVESARAYYERAVQILRKSSPPNHPDLGRTLAEYASFQLATGDSLASLGTALEAARINREHVRLTVRGIAERQALLYIADMDTGMDVALMAISGTLGSRSDDPIRQTWDALIRSRTLVLDEMSERARMVGRAGGLLDVAKRLEAARGRLANLMVHQASGEPTDRSRALIERAREEVERGERDLAARSASFRRERDRGDVGFDQVKSVLPSGFALVSFARYGQGRAQSYLAFVMPPDRRPRLFALGSAEPIDRLTARWRKLAGRPPAGGSRDRAERECRAAGEALRARVWDPFVRLLSGSREVFVVPDGSLLLLNFVALPTSEGGYLIESPYIVHYLSSERDLATSGDRPEHGAGLLAVGGVAFDARESAGAVEPAPPRPSRDLPSGARSRSALREGLPDCDRFRSVRFQPLPETVTEVDEIARLWGRPDEVLVLTGQGAGERRVKELLPGKRVAHFATHGFFLDSDCGRREPSEWAGERGIGGLSASEGPRSAPSAGANPFRLSGLALAGANRRQKADPKEEDGILTAEEITSLDLSGLEWAVLSACDTGVGDSRSGEGILGLRRAFEAAGASTLIMSLWAVEDRSAREWMTTLYEGRFKKDLDTAEAVRAADLGVLHSLRAQGRSTLPFYWASFVAAGDWR